MASTLGVENISHTNGTNAMTVSSGGVITFPNTPVGADGNPIAKTNTPYFWAKRTSAQTLTRNVTTEITGFTTNEIDSDNAFDGNAFTVPSGEAGKYYFSCQLKHAFASAGNDGERFFVQFRKTSGGVNSTIGLSDFFKASGYNIYEATNSLSAIIDLDVGDTVKVLGFNKDGDASGNAKVSSDSFFMGFKLIG